MEKKNDLLTLNIKLSIYSVKRYISNTEFKYYLFIGHLNDDIIDICNKCLKNNETTHEIKILKSNLKKDYDRIFLFLKNTNTVLINDTIYSDDTITSIKNKIECYLSNDDEYISALSQHLWVDTYNDINLEFIDNIFTNLKKNRYVLKTELIDYLKNINNYDIDLTNIDSTFDEKIYYNDFIYYFKNDVKHILSNNQKTLGIQFKRNNQCVFYNPNIITLLNSDNEIIDNDFHEYKIFSESTKILESYGEIKENIINLNYVYDTLDIIRKNHEDLLNHHKIYDNFIKKYWYSIDKKYWTKLIKIKKEDYSLKTDDKYNEKKFDKLKRLIIDSKELFNYYFNIEKGKSVSEFGLKEAVIHINYPGNPDNFIDLQEIFNLFETNYDIPFIKYKPKDSLVTYFKIYKNGIERKKTGNPFISEKTIKTWKDNIIYNSETQKWKTTTKPDYLTFKISKVNDEVEYTNDGFIIKDYLTLNIFPDGRLEIIATFGENMNSNFNTIYSELENISSIIEKINNIKFSKNNKKIILPDLVNFFNIKITNLGIYLISNEFDISIDNDDFTRNTNLLKYFINNLDIDKRKNLLYNLKYKRINYFYSMNEVASLITELSNNGEKPNDIINYIEKTFDYIKTQQQAINEYDTWLENVRIEHQLTHKGSKYLFKNNPGIDIKILDISNRIDVFKYKFIITGINFEKNIPNVLFLTNNILEILNGNLDITEEVGIKNVDNIIQEADIIQEDKKEDIKNELKFNTEIDLNIDLNNLLSESDNDLNNNVLKNDKSLQIEEKPNMDNNVGNNDSEKNIIIKKKFVKKNIGCSINKNRKSYDCSRYFSNRLSNYDNVLFSDEYTRKCQSAQLKQPIVLTEEEFENININDLDLSLKYEKNKVDNIIGNLNDLILEKDFTDLVNTFKIDYINVINNLLSFYGKNTTNISIGLIIYNFQILHFKLIEITDIIKLEKYDINIHGKKRTIFTKNRNESIEKINNIIKILDNSNLPLKSYNNVLKYGEYNLYYICPDIWCIECELSISSNPILFDTDNKFKCPICDKKEIEKIKNRKDNESLLVKKVQKHPTYPYYIESDSVCLPCCGNKNYLSYLKKENKNKAKVIHCEKIDIKSEESEKKFDYYILNADKELDKDRIGFMPKILNKLFENNDDYIKDNKIAPNSFYYLRQGTMESNKSFIFAFKEIYNKYLEITSTSKYKKIQSDNDFLQLLVDNLDPCKFMSINKGELVTLFDTSEDIIDISLILSEYNYNDLIKWLQKYDNLIKLFNVDYKKKFSQIDLSIINSEVKNIYLLFYLKNSFENFINYIMSPNSSLNYNDFWVLFSSTNFIFNKGLNIFIFDIDKYDTDSKPYLLCPNNYNLDDYITLSGGTNYYCFILKKNDHFEPIVKLERIKDKNDITKIMPIFEIMKGDSTNIINKVSTMFRVKCEVQKYISGFMPLEEYVYFLKRLDPGFHIKNVVIDNYFKVILIITENNTFIPVSPSALDCNLLKNYSYSIISGTNMISNLNTIDEFIENFQNIFDSYLQIKIKKIKIKNPVILKSKSKSKSKSKPKYDIIKSIIVDSNKNINGIELTNNFILPLKSSKYSKKFSKYNIVDSDSSNNIYELNDNIFIDKIKINDMFYNLNKELFNEESYIMFKYQISKFLNKPESNVLNNLIYENIDSNNENIDSNNDNIDSNNDNIGKNNDNIGKNNENINSNDKNNQINGFNKENTGLNNYNNDNETIYESTSYVHLISEILENSIYTFYEKRNILEPIILKIIDKIIKESKFDESILNNIYLFNKYKRVNCSTLTNTPDKCNEQIYCKTDKGDCKYSLYHDKNDYLNLFIEELIRNQHKRYEILNDNISVIPENIKNIGTNEYIFTDYDFKNGRVTKLYKEGLERYRKKIHLITNSFEDETKKMLLNQKNIKLYKKNNIPKFIQNILENKYLLISYPEDITINPIEFNFNVICYILNAINTDFDNSDNNFDYTYLKNSMVANIDNIVQTNSNDIDKSYILSLKDEIYKSLDFNKYYFEIISYVVSHKYRLIFVIFSEKNNIVEFICQYNRENKDVVKNRYIFLNENNKNGKIIYEPIIGTKEFFRKITGITKLNKLQKDIYTNQFSFIYRRSFNDSIGKYTHKIKLLNQTVILESKKIPDIISDNSIIKPIIKEIYARKYFITPTGKKSRVKRLDTKEGKCIFPFKDKSKKKYKKELLNYDCIGKPNPWCATKIDKDQYFTNWGYCDLDKKN